LGIAVLIIPFSVKSDVVKKEVPIMTLITLGLSVLFLDTLFDSSETNMLSRADGIILILFFSIFVFYLITVLTKKENADDIDVKPKYKVPMSIVIIILGLAGIIIGSELVVSNVAALATSIGVSQKVISVTIISIGTSLPELVTVVIAAKKGENSMAIGSIVGSNIFNICIVLGLPVVILGEAATLAFNVVDIAFMTLAAVLLWIFAATNRKLKRYEAIILIAMYCGYVGYIFMV
jgi:cation:H+ antiporter